MTIETTALNRALETMAAMSAPRLFSPELRLFGLRRWWFGSRRYEDLWAFADAWSALCTLASLPVHNDALTLLNHMPEGLRSYGDELPTRDPVGFGSVVRPPHGTGGDRFYDDNAWLALALVRHHDLTRNPLVLQLSQRIFDFVVSGWSTDPTWSVPGGIRWKEPATNRSRNTCANGPAAELAALLYDRTGDEGYLEWADRIYGWTRHALLTGAGLYADRIAPDGEIEPTLWSYNQGTMIGAGVLIALSTKSRGPLDEAVDTATTYLRTHAVEDLLTQDPVFNAVFFRNLLLLNAVRPDARYDQLIREYGDAMWASQRLRHGYFAGKGSVLNNTAAMIQIYALVAGAPPHP